MSPKRRQPKRAQTKMPTNRNLDSSKRWQTETSIEQNLKNRNIDKPKHWQIKMNHTPYLKLITLAPRNRFPLPNY